MNKPSLRLMLNSLAFSTLGLVSCASIAPEPKPQASAPVSLQQLDQLQAEALEGSGVALKRYILADVAAHWPEFAGRVVVVQGDGEDGTTKPEFMHDFANAMAITLGRTPPADVLKQLADEEYRQSRTANGDGVPISRFVTTDTGNSFAVISMPSAVCRSCAKESPAKSMAQQCKPIHPDTLFFESRTRMRTVFHEEAHAVRHMQGIFNYRTEVEQHREEIVAYLYADMRLIQLYGVSGLLQAERVVTLEPLRHGSSRYYLSQPAHIAMLVWQRENAAIYQTLSPAALLAQAALLAEPNLLSAPDLKVLSQFELQVPFVQAGAGDRLKWLKQNPAGVEAVRDGEGCKWKYPALMQQIDARAIALSESLQRPHTRFFQSNPHRPQTLQGVTPFAYDSRDEVQGEAMVEFNNKYRAASCPAYSLEDMKPKRIVMPAPALAPPSAKELSQCPQ